MIKKNIPNAITLLNLFIGCSALAYIFVGAADAIVVTYFVLAALCCDFADGAVARALNVHSELGKQLDSLADMVSFGVVPGALFFHLLYAGVAANFWLALPAFLVTVFSGLRLAVFNIDTRQSDVFIGLATPASTTFVVGLYYLIQKYEWARLANVYLYLIIAVLSLLLVAPVPMFSNKFKGSAWRGNEIRYAFMGIALVSLAIFQVATFAPLIILYICLSLIINILNK